MGEMRKYWPLFENIKDITDGMKRQIASINLYSYSEIRSRKQNALPNKETISCMNFDFYDFYDYAESGLDFIR